jgi:hypothetical protein
MAAVYLTLGTDDTEADKIVEKGKDRNGDLKWGDIFRLESIVLRLQPPDVLQRNVWIVRERFREIAGPSIYKAYIASNPPTETNSSANIALLRADLSRLLDVLHWYYALLPDRERLRKHLTSRCTKSVMIYTVILLAILVGCLYEQAHLNFTFPYLHFTMRNANMNTSAAIAACVVYWGIIGGFVSSQRRMQTIPSDGDPLISVLGLDDAQYYLWLSPLLGAVFAVILTWMFMGGLVSGSIFPAFNIVGQKNPFGFEELFHWPAMTGPAEYAKLFLWSFLAGFAERLVPDNLDRLASKLQVDDRSTAPAPLAPNPAIPAASDNRDNQDEAAPKDPKAAGPVPGADTQKDVPSPQPA